MRLADRLLAGLSLLLTLMCRMRGADAAGSPMTAQLVVRPLPIPSALRHATLTAGDTLSRLFDRLGVPPAQQLPWLDAAGRELNSRSLPVGLVAEASIDMVGEVRQIRLTPDWRAAVVLDRGVEGVAARREKLPTQRSLIVVRGTVASSLFDAVGAAGENETLAMALADLFGWDIDFHREVRQGDTFSLLVERISSGGVTVAYGPVLAATYANEGRRFTALRFAPSGGTEAYFDARGNPLRKQFLRAPLRFSRVSSRFSTSRLHPVLGVRLPHWGVDYAAPVGTPVMATADGLVTFTGQRGGAGNAVELSHHGGFVTAYLHLSRFASGVRPGARVSQGQVIGFVGSTGMSTGPHLDYRITQAGRHVNPLRMGGDPAPPLPASEVPRLARWAETVLPLLTTPGSVPGTTVAGLHRDAPVHLDS
jgi:murein DD-endopeptidase MepM/ murein hydrolase activator NlpD